MAKIKRVWVNDGVVAEDKRPPWQYTQQINEALLSLQRRIDRVEKTAAKQPAQVLNVAVEGRQGSYHITWTRVIGAEGYSIEMYSDSSATTIVQRIPIHDSQTVYWSIPVGNSATTRYFRVFAVNGNQVSNPSKIVSAASVAYGAGESAPTAPPVPSPPSTQDPPEFGGEIL